MKSINYYKTVICTALFCTSFMTSRASFDTVNVGPGLSNTFSPASVTICLGDTVLFIWNSGFHNVHITDPVDTTSANLTGPGDYFLYIPPAAGTYDYQCDFHVMSGMVGTIVVNNAPSAIVNNITPGYCVVDSNATIDITATGGGLTYFWSTFATTQDVAGLAPDTYSVEVINSCGIFILDSIIVPEPLSMNAGVVIISNISCNGDSDGAMDMFYTGGSGSVVNIWSTGETSGDIYGLSAGTYTVTVVDNVCNDTSEVSQSISEPDAITVSWSFSWAGCYGSCDGYAEVVAAGGSPNYTYMWSTGATTDSIGGLCSDEYYLTVTDANNCVFTDSVFIDQPTEKVLSINGTNVPCPGDSNGLADLSVSGGLTPYTYFWSNSATTQDITGLTAGTYTVSVLDATCPDSAVASVTITEPAVMSVSVVGSDITCTGANDGSADLTVTNGSGSFSYAWSTGASTEDIDSLPAGSYTVTVVDVTCSDTATVSVTINEPATVLSITLSSTDVSCGGGSDGAVDLTPSGGTTPYAFTWSNSATTEDIGSLVAGDYTVTVTDANLCVTLIDTVTITQPSALATSAVKTDVTGCPGDSTGSIDLTVTGGITPYTYSWNNGATDEDIDSLPAGAYGCTVTDAGGCTKTRSVMIFNPSAVTLFQTIVTHVECNGDSTGAINIFVMGGTSPYSYLWSNSETTEDLAAVPSGAYTVTVTDAKSCTVSGTMTVTQPAAMSLALAAIDVSCMGGNDGIADLTVTGGSGSFLYFWSDGSNSEDADSLTAGTYTVTIWDGTCSKADSSTIIVNEPSAPLVVTRAVGDVSCGGGNDGGIDLTVSGGISPYQFAWSTTETTEDVQTLTAGIYTCTVTDSAGCVVAVSDTIDEPLPLSVTSAVTDAVCNGSSDGAADITVSGGTGPYTYSWSNSETTEDISGLAAGTYYVSVTDFKSCLEIDSATVNEPDVLSATISPVHVNCTGDSTGGADVTVTGGSGSFQYAWSSGETTEDLTGIASGTYTVTVTDTVCSNSSSATVNINEPALALSATSSGTNPLCNGDPTGLIDLTVTGGTPSYSFVWSEGSTTEDAGNLGAGNYSVTITDSLGCQVAVYDTIDQPAALFVSTTVNNASGCSQADGDATATATGGTPGYTYLWEAGAGNQTTSTATGLAIGSYDVTATDANGCTAATTANVSSAGAPSVTATVSDVSCFGNADGAIDVAVSGGTLPYTHLWSTGDSSEDLTGLLPGTYTDTLTDSAGCRIITDFTVNEPGAISFAAVITDVSCSGAGDGAINLSVTGGTGGYTHSWSTGSTAEDLTDLDGGVYSDTVSDANGCLALFTDTVNEPASLTLSTSVTDAACFGGSDGSIDLTVNGGTPSYSYLWSDSSAAEDLNSLGADAYAVTVTDANGCTATDMAFVNEPSVLSASVSGTNVSCNGFNNGGANLTVSGGSGNFNYLWSDNSTNEDLSGVVAGSYTVTVADASCSDTVTASVTINEPAVVSILVTGINVTCFGLCDGSYNVTASGGTAPYTGTGTVSNLCQGSYTVTVTDNKGCTVYGGVTITQPTALTLSTSVTNATCNGQCDGSATVTVSGGSPAYFYTWCNSSTGSTATGLCAGSCSIIVNDVNGCMVSSSVNIGQPSAMTVVVSATDESACGANDGQAIATNFGGNPPYTYLWSNGATSPFQVGLSYGIYTITITDVNGCTATGLDTVDCPISISGLTVKGDDWFISPNPTHDGIIILSGSGVPGGKISVEVTNLLGESLLSYNGYSLKNSFSGTFDMSHAGKGIYMMHIRTSYNSWTRKIVVH